MERSTQIPGGNNIHNRYNLVTGTPKKFLENSIVTSLISVIIAGGILAIPYYKAFKASERARGTLNSLEITDAQRRVLEDYERVMNELNLQIKDVSEGEFSIEDKPPTVHGMYIPLNKPNN